MNLSLLYTGLRRPPVEIAWNEAPCALEYELTLRADSRGFHERRRTPRFPWPAVLALSAGDSVEWSITAIGAESRETSGRFWLLDAGAASNLEEAEGIVGGIEDVFARGLARALARARLGLFGEAISHLEKELQLIQEAGRRALVQRALVAVLTQMQDSLAERSNRHAELWIRHRLASHRGDLESGLGWP